LSKVFEAFEEIEFLRVAEQQFWDLESKDIKTSVKKLFLTGSFIQSDGKKNFPDNIWFLKDLTHLTIENLNEKLFTINCNYHPKLQEIRYIIKMGR
jgi:hypothetical protein